MELQKLGSSRALPLGIGTWLTPRNTPLPTSYSVEFGHSVSSWGPKKLRTLGPAFFG